MRGGVITPPACGDGPAGSGQLPCLPTSTPTPVERQQQHGPAISMQPTPDTSSSQVNVAVPAQLADFPGWVWVVLALLAGAVLILAFLLIRSILSGRTRRHLDTAHNPQAPLPPLGSGDLLQALIGVYDLSTSDVVRAHVQKSLRTAGVTAIDPMPGDPFDNGLHNGVAVVPSPSPELVLCVARVLRPGWLSTDSVLRPADVEVYKE